MQMAQLWWAPLQMSPEPFSTLECELQSLGLTVRPDKCTAWSPVSIPPTLQLPIGPTPQGMVVLGVPLGEAARVGQAVQATLERQFKTLPALPTLHDSQLAVAILTRCVAQRPTYLQRAVPPTTALDNIYAAADVSLQQALLGLLDHPALPTTPAALLQMTLPIGKGGLGCRSLAHLARAAHRWGVGRKWPPQSQRASSGGPVLAPAIAGVANGTLPFQTSLSDVRRDLLRSFPSLAADQVDFTAWARCSDLKAQARYSRPANEQAMSRLQALLKEGWAWALSSSIHQLSGGVWLSALPIYESLRLSDDLFRTAVHHHLGLPPLCLAIWLAFDSANVVIVRRMRSLWQLTCFNGSKCNASHNLLRDAVYGLLREAGYHAAMEVPGIMPVLQKRGRPYIRRLDVVATPRSGGLRLLLDVVLIDAFQPGALTPLGDASCGDYNDHPQGDHFFPCTMDMYGGYETKWSSLLHRLALHVDARLRSRADSLGHSSVPQVIVACCRMRLSLSLQCSQALAVHQRAGRALAQANTSMVVVWLLNLACQICMCEPPGAARSPSDGAGAAGGPTQGTRFQEPVLPPGPLSSFGGRGRRRRRRHPSQTPGRRRRHRRRRPPWGPRRRAGPLDWLTTHAIHNAFKISPEAFRTLLQLFLGLPPTCLIGVTQCECGFRTEGGDLATHMLRCPTGPEVVGVHNLLRDALAGLMRDAGYRAIVEVSNVMPITTDSQGGHHRRTLDI
eukprot:SM000069S20680  [mRNA]  locus=s69:132810:139001:- [translate_table: standard]